MSWAPPATPAPTAKPANEHDHPIVDFVRSYAQSGTARLHMPGHKGQSLLGFEPLDITEIRGADELYAPEGIIAESEANATRLFGTAHSYYSTEGSSQCIRAMLFLALQSAPQNGKRPVLLAARNAHKADRKSTRLNSSHDRQSRMPSSA